MTPLCFRGRSFSPRSFRCGSRRALNPPSCRTEPCSWPSRWAEQGAPSIPPSLSISPGLNLCRCLQSWPASGVPPPPWDSRSVSPATFFDPVGVLFRQRLISRFKSAVWDQIEVKNRMELKRFGLVRRIQPGAEWIMFLGEFLCLEENLKTPEHFYPQSKEQLI